MKNREILAILAIIAIVGFLSSVVMAMVPKEEKDQSGQQTGNFVPDEVLVKYKDKKDHEKIKVVSGDVLRKINELKQRPDVEYAEPNYIGYPTALPNDPLFSKQWSLNNIGQTGGTVDADIDAPEAWDITTGSGTVIVAVLDTGVDCGHPDLATNCWTNPGEIAGNGIDDDSNGYIDDVSGWNFVNNNNNPMDISGTYGGHGTHVAGIIGAVGNNGVGISGISQNVKIMSLRFIASTGGTFEDMARATDYAVANGASVIATSFGCLGCYSITANNSIARANEKGVLFVAAAGNNGVNIDSVGFYPASSPVQNVISVAATGSFDQLMSWSNYGLTVHLGAPGDNIYSTVPTWWVCPSCIPPWYTTMSGTSMASPHVSGVAALLKANNGSMDADEIKNKILTSVNRIPSLNGKTLTGGRLNAYQSLSDTMPGNDPPTADNQKVVTVRNTALSIVLTGFDPDGDSLTYRIVSQPQKGTLVLDSNFVTNGRVVYNPPRGFVGNVAFTFVVNDGKIDSAPATISVQVIKNK